MNYDNVLKLACDIDEVTHGDFLKDYSIGVKNLVDGFCVVTLINTNTQAKMISGPPNFVYSYLLAFYRGMSYGLRQANKLFDKYKVDAGVKLAQLLHIKECRVDELEDKKGDNDNG